MSGMVMMGKVRARGRVVGLASLALTVMLGLTFAQPAAAQAQELTTGTVVEKTIQAVSQSPEVINQTKPALKSYKVKKYKLLKNKNYGKYNPKKFKTTAQYATGQNKITTKKGNKKATFTTLVHLPLSYAHSGSYKGPGDMGNPQSINVTPDGHYAYVSYARLGQKSSANRWGRICKFDLWKLADLGVTTPGSMDKFRRATHQNCSNPAKLTEEQKELISCMEFSDEFQFGHGAAMSLNPADGCLWYTTKTKKNKTDLCRFNTTTMKTDLIINFTMSKKHSVTMGNNLAFDSQGRFYFFGYSSGGWKKAPKGTVKIYQGTIANNKVSVKLVMQGIKNSLSSNGQSMGYNPKSDRLYLVANSSIMSVPVKKLGKLKNKDVQSTVFNNPREYEGISFDANGVGYLIVNKYSEIMTTPAGF